MVNVCVAHLQPPVPCRCPVHPYFSDIAFRLFDEFKAGRSLKHFGIDLKPEQQVLRPAGPERPEGREHRRGRDSGRKVQRENEIRYPIVRCLSHNCPPASWAICQKYSSGA